MKQFVKNSPHLYGVVGRIREDPALSRRVVRKGDDCVIEGFPRSANTFATYAFRQAQPNEMRIGNHTHAPAQIRRARGFNVPCLVVIRNPGDAVSSFLMYTQGQVSADASIRRWLNFYEVAWRYRSVCSFATFEEVTTSFGRSIERLNTKFGTDFVPYENSELADRAVMETIELGRVARARRSAGGEQALHRQTTPSVERKALKDLQTAGKISVDQSPVLAEAVSLYERILSDAFTK